MKFESTNVLRNKEFEMKAVQSGKFAIETNPGLNGHEMSGQPAVLDFPCRKVKLDTTKKIIDQAVRQTFQIICR